MATIENFRITMVLLIFGGHFYAVVLSQFVNPAVPNRKAHCPGDALIFDCEASGSTVIGWRSNEYIGVGNQLEFSTVDNLGRIITASVDANTVATLTNKSNDDGEILLRSQLSIIISASSFILCVDVANDNIINMLFVQVLAVPEAPPQMTAYQTEDAIGRCTVHISWIWTSPVNIAISDVSHFIIYIEGVNVLNITNNNNETLLSAQYPVCSCGAHRISITAVNRCGIEGTSIYSFVDLSPETLQHDLVCGVDSTITDYTPASPTIAIQENNGSPYFLPATIVLGSVVGVLLVVWLIHIIYHIVRRYNALAHKDTPANKKVKAPRSEMDPELTEKISKV